MPAFSTVIMGLYPTVMHSSLRLAPLQMERQRGKGTGCHNLASHSGQAPQLQTHTHMDKQARAPTPVSTHMNDFISKITDPLDISTVYVVMKHRNRHECARKHTCKNARTVSCTVAATITITTQQNWSHQHHTFTHSLT